MSIQGDIERVRAFGQWLDHAMQNARLVVDPDPDDPRSVTRVVNTSVSQGELSRMIGRSQSWVNKVVRGREVPGSQTVEQIAVALGADPDEAFLALGRLRPELTDWIVAGGIERVRAVRLACHQHEQASA